jgi:hypothetical protein
MKIGWIPFIQRRGDPHDPAASQQYAAEKDTAPLKLRQEILEKAGANYFIDRLVASPPSMSAKETERATQAFKQLESGTIPEREQAIKDFKALGAKSAPVLHKMLKGEDGVWKSAAQDLLNEWAER